VERPIPRKPILGFRDLTAASFAAAVPLGGSCVVQAAAYFAEPAQPCWLDPVGDVWSAVAPGVRHSQRSSCRGLNRSSKQYAEESRPCRFLPESFLPES
jgi:hypothetical protein